MLDSTPQSQIIGKSNLYVRANDTKLTYYQGVEVSRISSSMLPMEALASPGRLSLRTHSSPLVRLLCRSSSLMGVRRMNCSFLAIPRSLNSPLGNSVLSIRRLMVLLRFVILDPTSRAVYFRMINPAFEGSTMPASSWELLPPCSINFS